jgi:hypothetical protein
MLLSSGKVVVVVLFDIVRSLVYIRCRTGLKKIPCVTPASVFVKIIILSLKFS